MTMPNYPREAVSVNSRLFRHGRAGTLSAPGGSNRQEFGCGDEGREGLDDGPVGVIAAEVVPLHQRPAHIRDGFVGVMRGP
jgi:hypothetical protein